MLIKPAGSGVYGATLHSQRELEECKGSVLELAKRFWHPDENGIILGNRPLKTLDDIEVVASTKELNESRADYQKTSTFKYDVGEVVNLSMKRAVRLLISLSTTGMPPKERNVLNDMLADNRRTNQNGSLTFHIVHLGDDIRAESGYEMMQVFSSFREKKPHYELTPRKRDAEPAHLFFLPKELAESLLLYDLEPKALRIYRHFSAKQ